MPRRRKGTQPVNYIPGGQYGQGVAQQQGMRVMPLRDAEAQREIALAEVNDSQVGPAPNLGEGAGAPPGAPAPPLDFAAALDAARMTAPPRGELNQPMAQAASPRSTMGDLWLDVARMTGDPRFLRVAQQARLSR